MYTPAQSGHPVPNPAVFVDLKPGETYRVKSLGFAGYRPHSAVPQDLSPKDLEGRTISGGYGKPLTNVVLTLEGITGTRFYGYFSSNSEGIE